MTQIIGTAKARELYLTAERFGSERAEQLGLVNMVFDDHDFEASAIAYTKQFAEGPTVAYRYMKENINRAVTADLMTCLDAEASAMTRTGLTEDHRLAVEAFVEKRTPIFSGH